MITCKAMQGSLKTKKSQFGTLINDSEVLEQHWDNVL